MPSARKPVRVSAATLLDQTAGTKIAKLRSQGTTSFQDQTSTTAYLLVCSGLAWLGLGPRLPDSRLPEPESCGVAQIYDVIHSRTLRPRQLSPTTNVQGPLSGGSSRHQPLGGNEPGQIPNGTCRLQIADWHPGICPVAAARTTESWEC